MKPIVLVFLTQLLWAAADNPRRSKAAALSRSVFGGPSGDRAAVSLSRSLQKEFEKIKLRYQNLPPSDRKTPVVVHTTPTSFAFDQNIRTPANQDAGGAGGPGNPGNAVMGSQNTDDLSSIFQSMDDGDNGPGLETGTKDFPNGASNLDKTGTHDSITGTELGDSGGSFMDDSDGTVIPGNNNGVDLGAQNPETGTSVSRDQDDPAINFEGSVAGIHSGNSKVGDDAQLQESQNGEPLGTPGDFQGSVQTEVVDKNTENELTSKALEENQGTFADSNHAILQSDSMVGLENTDGTENPGEQLPGTSGDQQGMVSQSTSVGKQTVTAQSYQVTTHPDQSQTSNYQATSHQTIAGSAQVQTLTGDNFNQKSVTVTHQSGSSVQSQLSTSQSTPIGSDNSQLTVTGQQNQLATSAVHDKQSQVSVEGGNKKINVEPSITEAKTQMEIDGSIFTGNLPEKPDAHTAKTQEEDPGHILMTKAPEDKEIAKKTDERALSQVPSFAKPEQINFAQIGLFWNPANNSLKNTKSVSSANSWSRDLGLKVQSLTFGGGSRMPLRAKTPLTVRFDRVHPLLSPTQHKIRIDQGLLRPN